MAKRQTKEDKMLDKEISLLYAKHCSGIQIDVWDISRVFAEARKARAEGQDMAERIRQFVEKIRKN